MNGFGLNAAGLNGAGNTNSFVAFPASTATFTVAMSERALSFLPATVMGLSVDSSGALISISPFAPTTATFSINSSGTLYRVAPMGNQAMGIDVAMSGNPILTGGLGGELTADVALSGQIRRITYFNEEVLGADVAMSGDLLASIRYMAGVMDLAVDLDGQIMSFRPMVGSMSLGIDVDGLLSVNATAPDLEENTWSHPYRELETVFS